MKQKEERGNRITNTCKCFFRAMTGAKTEYLTQRATAQLVSYAIIMDPALTTAIPSLQDLITIEADFTLAESPKQRCKSRS